MNGPAESRNAEAAVLAALPAGVLAFGPTDRLDHCNPGAAALLGVDPRLLRPGLPRADLLRLLAHKGLFGPGEPDERLAYQLSLDPARPRRSLLRGERGTCLDLHHQPLPGGGCLLVLLDVGGYVASGTEHAEQARFGEEMLGRLRHGIALYDHAHRLRLANPAYGDLVGLLPDGMRPGTRYAALIRGVLARGESANVDPVELAERLCSLDRARPQSYRFERPDGRIVQAESRPMPDGGFLVELSDITAQQRAENEARRRAALLDGVLAELPHGVCVYGPDHRVAMFNAAYATVMQGASLAVGEHTSAIRERRAAAGEYGRGEAGERYRRLVALPPTFPQARWRVRPNGTAIDVRTAPLPDGGYISVVTDVTALQRAEAEASRRAGIQQVMLDNIRHGVCLFDAGHRLIAANSRAASITNHAMGPLTPGRAFTELLASQVAHGDFDTAHAADLASLDRGMANSRVRVQPDGTMLEVSSDPTPEGGFMLTFTDVTAAHRARAELERARAAAEEASLAKSRFLTAMSHELRTPLNAVIGFSEMLLAGRASPTQAGEFAGAIRDAGRHLLSLIDDLLDVARAESGLPVNTAAVPLPPILDEVMRVMQGGAEAAGLVLQLEPLPALPALRADPRRVRQILINLLGNAVKFTPSGGRVTVGAAPEPGGVLIRVADTGIGMAPEDVPRAFEPFVQLDAELARRYSGSGLGLYLSRALAEAQGGTLELRSRLGEGTEALLRLPGE